jgi:predicted phage gp36 major capsid-like protein
MDPVDDKEVEQQGENEKEEEEEDARAEAEAEGSEAEEEEEEEEDEDEEDEESDDEEDEEDEDSDDDVDQGPMIAVTVPGRDALSPGRVIQISVVGPGGRRLRTVVHGPHRGSWREFRAISTVWV